MIPLGLIYLSIRDLFFKIFPNFSQISSIQSVQSVDKMNIIILGQSKEARTFARHYLKSRVCCWSYSFHEKNNLEVDSWIPTTTAVILSESDFCGNFVGKRKYIEAGGLLLQISKNLKISEQTILEHFRLSDENNKNESDSTAPFYGPGRQFVIDREYEAGTEPEIYQRTFDKEKYFKFLKTELGSTIFHFNSISSTMDYFNDKNVWKNTVVIADSQLRGKGRKENEWISPSGSISVTFGFEIDLEISDHLAAVQHVIAIAICSALSRSKQVKCKWPNDIYWNRDIKLGGLLTKGSCSGSKLSVCCGFGLNLNNQLPQPGLNLLLEKENNQIDPFTREEIVAATLNNLDRMIPMLNSGEWRQQYYKYWLHQGEAVITNKGNGRVSGVDKDGFLKVEINSGIFEYFDTDNNSFDLMTGLISRK